MRAFVLDDRPATNSGLICLIGLGGFLLFGATVPIAEGVSTPGRIVAESNRKVVQHLEGGIVQKLNVREGTVVRAGDVLVVLDDLRARAERDQYAQQVAALRASLDRLIALNTGKGHLAFSTTAGLGVAPDRLADIHAEQQRLFTQQRGAFTADSSVIDAKRTAMIDNASAKQGQMAAVERSLGLVRQHLAERRRLLADHLIRRDGVDELEQQEASLVTELARISAERGGELGEASQAGQERLKARAEFLRDLSNDLLKNRTELQKAEEGLRAAQDVLDRTVIRAPQSGKVLNLAFQTLGGVIKPGEPIMEIVPGSPTLIAVTRVKPQQRDAVSPGLPVRARLTVAKSWTAPRMEGRVLDVSADLKTDRETNTSYYEARLQLSPPPELTRRFRLTPGMPVEASIDSGVRRTFLSYLVEPVSDMIDRGL